MDKTQKKSFFTKCLFHQLETIQAKSKGWHGEIIWHDGSEYRFGTPGTLRVNVTIHNRAFYRKLLWRGSLGAAKSYIDGDWSCDNLTLLIQIIGDNMDALNTASKKRWLFLGLFVPWLKNKFSYNGIRQSRHNIKQHYDLSNDFFSLFLDKRKMYSSAIFEDDKQDLDSAQYVKLKHICDQLALTPRDHLLEIGTGWGGLAIFAAQNYGCKVTTTTLSSAQYDYVSRKIKRLNLTDRICLLKKDYRELTGLYDKLVSIEMIEAVGHLYFKTFLTRCDQLLKTNGKLFLQAITIKDDYYANYKNRLDFIKAYVFPGGCLPCLAIIKKIINRDTELSIQSIKTIGQDYAKTLTHWHKNFMSNQDAIRQLGFDDKLIRLFSFYFCYCRSGFLAGYINNLQIVMEKHS